MMSYSYLGALAVLSSAYNVPHSSTKQAVSQSRAGNRICNIDKSTHTISHRAAEDTTVVASLLPWILMAHFLLHYTPKLWGLKAAVG